MGGLFDKLGKKLENRDQEAGISPLDLVDLSPRLRRIMRLMLREVEISYPDLRESVVDDQGAMSGEELDEALERLHSQGWLLRLGQGEKVTYKANLRRKRGSTLGGGIWEALDNRLKQKKESPPNAETGGDTA